MEEVARKILPAQYSLSGRTSPTRRELAGNTALFIFPLCILFVWLTHSAEYESFALSTAIILIVPMCLLCGIAGVWLRHMDNNIFTQIGFVVLAGMSVKNAVLIVEFAKQQQEHNPGMNAADAAVEAAHLRLRPILMTSFTFIFGVLPLVSATGAGAEMRQALGHGRLFRHARRNLLRRLLHARLLHRHPPAYRQERAGRRARDGAGVLGTVHFAAAW